MRFEINLRGDDGEVLMEVNLRADRDTNFRLLPRIVCEKTGKILLGFDLKPMWTEQESPPKEDDPTARVPL